jgi:hypothetical protein
MKEVDTPKPCVVRKPYQTDCRPLADIMFGIGMVIALMALLELPSGLGIPAPVTFALVSLFCAVLYALLTNTLTVFRVSLPTILLAALVVFGLTFLLIEMKPAPDMQKLSTLAPLLAIGASQVLEEMLRSMRRE